MTLAALAPTAQTSLLGAGTVRDWPFGDLVAQSYQLIMADPPWAFKLYSERGEEKAPQAHYRCMETGAIAALPVGSLADRDAVLFLWATAPMLPEALGVMKAWGFRFVSMGFWHKRTSSGKSAFGTGYRLRSAGEPWLIGVAGNPVTSRSHRNVIEAQTRRHSQKPESAYGWCETYMPGAKRCELFSRASRMGWDCWGDETGKFDAG